MQPNIFWDPTGVSLDTIGERKLDEVKDGDTLSISISIRLLSIDTPETHYPGRANPDNHDDKLADLGTWLQQGDPALTNLVSPGLAAHLIPKLTTGRAGTLQRSQGDEAERNFRGFVDIRATQPGRDLFIRAADEHFDSYGRILAYVAPSYTKQERLTLSVRDRQTFNLQMVHEGWAASFPIHPSLPKHSDLVLLYESAEEAFGAQRGIWADDETLLGYEFRMCYRLWKTAAKLRAGDDLSTRDRFGWVERYCADMTTRKIHYPQDYHKVLPFSRLFIWPKDVKSAVAELNLSAP